MLKLIRVTSESFHLFDKFHIGKVPDSSWELLHASNLFSKYLNLINWRLQWEVFNYSGYRKPFVKQCETFRKLNEAVENSNLLRSKIYGRMNYEKKSKLTKSFRNFNSKVNLKLLFIVLVKYHQIRTPTEYV